MSHKGATQLEFKVGKSGWVSVYWGARFPATLPGEVWERILKNENKLRQFIEEERAAGNLKEKVSVKPAPEPEPLSFLEP